MSKVPPLHPAATLPWWVRAETSGWGDDWWAPLPDTWEPAGWECRGSPSPPEGAGRCDDARGVKPWQQPRSQRGRQTAPSSSASDLQICPVQWKTKNRNQTKTITIARHVFSKVRLRVNSKGVFLFGKLTESSPTMRRRRHWCSGGSFTQPFQNESPPPFFVYMNII